jgi:uncharacterized membrane protein
MIADVSAVTSEKSGHKFISAIMYIGSTGLSLGALLLIASNWAGLSKVVKLILALLLPILPICFAYWQLNVRNESKVIGRVANILGLALVGGSLSLIGQTYNLESNTITLLWTWALLTALFVFVFKKKENVLFSAAMVGAALLFSIFDFLENSRMEVGTAVLLVTIASLTYAYLLYAVGSGLRYVTLWADSSRFLRIGAAGLASTVLFVMTFGWYAQTIVGHSYRNPGNWEVLSFAFNILFIGFLVFSLIRSIKFEEYSFAFSMVRLFGLYLLVKYFTLFYSMLDTGIFFIIGGVLFITGGWILEKKKDTLVAYMRGSVNNADSYDQ